MIFTHVKSTFKYVTPPIDNHGESRDVNASLQLSLSLCIPTGADFDGDELTVFGIVGYQATMECVAFKWNHKQYSPYDLNAFKHLVHRGSSIIVNEANTTAICTIICWSDRLVS